MSTLVRQREGSGPPLVLLHPLGADARFFAPLLEHVDPEAWTADVNPTEAGPTAGGGGRGPGGRVAVGARRACGARRRLPRRAGRPAPRRRASRAWSPTWSSPTPWSATRCRCARCGRQRATGVLGPRHGVDPRRHARDLVRRRRGSLRGTRAGLSTAGAGDRPGDVRRACLALRDADTSTLLDRIQAPTLVLCGDHDAALPGRQHAAGRASGSCGRRHLAGRGAPRRPARAAPGGRGRHHRARADRRVLSPPYAVGFVGLGAMGSQLSRHALEAGREVWVPRPRRGAESRRSRTRAPTPQPTSRTSRGTAGGSSPPADREAPCTGVVDQDRGAPPATGAARASSRPAPSRSRTRRARPRVLARGKASAWSTRRCPGPASRPPLVT